MGVLTEDNATTYEVGFLLGTWVFSFFDTLVGLFITIFLLISHEDLQ